MLQEKQGLLSSSDARPVLPSSLGLVPPLQSLQAGRRGSADGGYRRPRNPVRPLPLRIMDEPTAALSPARVSSAFDLIQTLPPLGSRCFSSSSGHGRHWRSPIAAASSMGGRVAMEGDEKSLLSDGRAAELYLGQSRQSVPMFDV